MTKRTNRIHPANDPKSTPKIIAQNGIAVKVHTTTAKKFW